MCGNFLLTTREEYIYTLSTLCYNKPMNKLRLFKKNHMVQTRGFTLKKFLIIVAIITIIIISFLGYTRNKSKDSDTTNTFTQTTLQKGTTLQDTIN